MARLLDRLVGHDETMATLLEAAARNRLASTLLFAGPSGVGKRLAAQVLAQNLICERPVQSNSIRHHSMGDVLNSGDRRFLLACGECGSCLRIERGQSESLLQIEPDGSSIKIEQARGILQFLQLRKSGRARVVLIDQAHFMNAQVANSLLKVFEEPPQGTFFILVTSMAASLLSTIRSRSQMVRFKPLTEGDLKAVLGPSADEWTLRSAHGSVEVANRLLESREDLLETENAVAQFLAIGYARFPSDEISRVKEFTKDRQAQTFVAGVIQGLLRDVLRVQSGQPASSGARFPEIIEAIALLPKESVRELAERSIEMEQDFARNVDRGLVLENFAIHWRRAADQRVSS